VAYRVDAVDIRIRNLPAKITEPALLFHMLFKKDGSARVTDEGP